MERLLVFTHGATFKWENKYRALIYATVIRSSNTFASVCILLRAEMPAQAAMLTRTLFEDVIVAHWLVLNSDDPDWLVERYIRHREAIALHQRRMQEQTGWAMGPPISARDDIKSRQNELGKEFGGEAQGNWWDPGEDGHGQGRPVGLRKVALRLELAAAEHRMFHPRFAGGEEPLLEKMELVANKWLSQFIHHTAVGLPFGPTSEKTDEPAGDPTVMVAFNAFWLFTQQIHLLHDVDQREDRKHIDTVFVLGLAKMGAVFLDQEDIDRLVQSWEQHYGDSVD